MRPASLALSVLVCSSPAAMAQTAPAPYPTKPIRFIIPFPPGGPADILGRTIGQNLGERWSQQVVIDNRAGAGGNVGADIVAKSLPDGYTLFMATIGTHAINPSLYGKLPFDHIRDFDPIGMVSMVTIVLVTHPTVAAGSVKDVIALAKSKPGELTFGSPGNGTPQHLAGELFNTLAHVQTLHVPYKGAVPALQDLLGGRISMTFASMPPALPHVKLGKIKALAVTSTKRSAAAPELPTVAEAGVPGFEVLNWYGVSGPAGMPKELVARLNGEIRRIMTLPDVKERLAAQGAEVLTSSPQEFGAFVRSETAKWAKVVKFSGAKVD